MTSPHVDILLSTFNGEKYLEIQLDSLFQQDYVNWTLLVRDDGSTDTTLAILEKYRQQYPDKIKILNDSDGNIGYCRSFTKLLQQSSAEYVMYCDQDDHWNPDKISKLLSVIAEEEAKLPGRAHLVFSDLQTTNSEMKVSSGSFLKRTHYLSRYGVQIFFLKNYIPGCNILFNRTLVSYAMKTDNLINLHDHWLFMVCSSIGKITFLDESLMKYRIHDKNAIGFKESQSKVINKVVLFFKEIIKYGFANKKYRNLVYSQNIKQMINICDQFSNTASKEAKEFAEIDQSNYLTRKFRNIWKPYILENSILKQIIYIICF